MREIKTTCDKCGLLIEPLDEKFEGSGSSLAVLSYSGQLGHNQVPLGGWHFHYSCFCQIINAIRKELLA